MMNKYVRATVYMLVILAGLSGRVAVAEQGDWLVRLRGIYVDPIDDSGLISLNGAPLPGSGVGVNSNPVPEIDVTYMLLRNVGIEVIAGITNHDVEVEGSALAGLGVTNGFKIFDAWVLPPTVTLQYHFLPEGSIRPYVGIGVNYTTFLDENATRNLETTLASPVSVGMTNSWGWAAQGGVDITLKDNWFINIDVKYIDIDATASLGVKNLGARLEVDANIDPIVFGAGIGYRF